MTVARPASLVPRRKELTIHCCGLHLLISGRIARPSRDLSPNPRVSTYKGWLPQPLINFWAPVHLAGFENITLSFLPFMVPAVVDGECAVASNTRSSQAGQSAGMGSGNLRLNRLPLRCSQQYMHVSYVAKGVCMVRLSDGAWLPPLFAPCWPRPWPPPAYSLLYSK